MNWVIYKKSTGQIIKSLACSEEIAILQLETEDDAYLQAVADDSKQYIVENVVIDMPPKPSQHHVFDYTTKQWIDPRTPETEWPLVRAERDRRLLASDWTQLPDVPLATKEAWAIYRQALRDITLQSDPFNIIWPEPPQ